MTAQTGNKMADSREPKVGDVVHVRGIVEYRYPYGETRILFGGSNSTTFVNNPDIVHIEPAPLKAGDRVLVWGTDRATIKCLDGKDAWCTLDCTHPYGFRHVTVALSDLTRIEASDGAGS